MAQQVMEVSHPSSKGEGTPNSCKPNLVFYESESEGQDDPMVSGAFALLTTQVEILVPHSGARQVFTALLDSGCTHCLVSLLYEQWKDWD